jgi:hypothetical protein
MPIKFRCNYCRQFLGISRAQAGGIVDCPTCGRSIRVPQLDGSLQPLPEPELNLQDAHLARALDELARLGLGDSQPLSNIAAPSEEFEEGEENEIPQPIPEPIPIEVPIPPTPIAINPAPPDEDDEPDLPATVEYSPRAALEKHSSMQLIAELSSLTPPSPGAGQTETPGSAAASPVRRPASMARSLPQVSIMIALGFIAGMLFERFMKVLEAPRTSTATSSASTEGTESAAVSQLTGRITYKSADGSSQPDRGARIIAFPQQREGESKLSVVGFRPADGTTDAKVAAATLQALGGGVATADEAGKFRLDVPAGTYQLLVLSHFQSRDESETVDAELRKLLTTYFDKPDDLLGRVKFNFGPLRVKGTGDVWDHSF